MSSRETLKPSKGKIYQNIFEGLYISFLFPKFSVKVGILEFNVGVMEDFGKIKDTVNMKGMPHSLQLGQKL